MESFNHHNVRTANNWSPYQMWPDGMLHEHNPLACGLLDEDPGDMEFYGDDPPAPSVFEDSGNSIIMDPVSIENGSDIQAEVLQLTIDPLKIFSHTGVDIYEEALELAKQRVSLLDGN